MCRFFSSKFSQGNKFTESEYQFFVRHFDILNCDVCQTAILNIMQLHKITYFSVYSMRLLVIVDEGRFQKYVCEF